MNILGGIIQQKTISLEKKGNSCKKLDKMSYYLKLEII